MTSKHKREQRPLTVGESEREYAAVWAAILEVRQAVETMAQRAGLDVPRWYHILPASRSRTWQRACRKANIGAEAKAATESLSGLIALGPRGGRR
jgi:hypothetical protein